MDSSVMHAETPRAPHAAATIPVFVLGVTPVPALDCFRLHKPQLEPLTRMDAFEARLMFALMRVPTVLIVGGFNGAFWPGMAAVCEVIALAADIPAADVRFRWVKDGPQALGAEFSAGPLVVHVISGEPGAADRMTRYLEQRLSNAVPAWNRKQEAAHRVEPVRDMQATQQRPPPAAEPLPEPVQEPPPEPAPPVVQEPPVPPEPPVMQEQSSPINPWLLPTSQPQPAPEQKQRTKKQSKKDVERNPKPRRTKHRAAPRVPAKAARRILTVILAIAVLAASGSGGYLLYYLWDSRWQDKVNASASQLYHDTQQASSYTNGGMLARFAGLYAQNSDVAGWLAIPAAQVDLPVMLSADNDYYLTRNFQKKVTRYGALFLDSSNVVSPQASSHNLSIYGHNTRNGTMFGQLRSFRDVAFYKKNPTFSFSTLYRESEWVIFAVMVTNADPKQDNGSFFDWRTDEIDSPTGAQVFLEEVRARSLIDTGITAEYGDKLLSLTTCCYDFKNARLVIFAREVRQGEVIDATGAVMNPTPKKPAAWK
jgi:sortase B